MRVLSAQLPPYRRRFALKSHMGSYHKGVNQIERLSPIKSAQKLPRINFPFSWGVDSRGDTCGQMLRRVCQIGGY
jgi:hypothetical protein